MSIWTIHPDGPDGRVDHFYADGNESAVEVVPLMDVYRWLQRRHGQFAAEAFLRHFGDK